MSFSIRGLKHSEQRMLRHAKDDCHNPLSSRAQALGGDIYVLKYSHDTSSMCLQGHRRPRRESTGLFYLLHLPYICESWSFSDQRACHEPGPREPGPLHLTSPRPRSTSRRKLCSPLQGCRDTCHGSMGSDSSLGDSQSTQGGQGQPRGWPSA